VAKDDGLPFAPVFVINLCTVLCNDVWHFEKPLLQVNSRGYFKICCFSITTITSVRYLHFLPEHLEVMFLIELRLAYKTVIPLHVWLLDHVFSFLDRSEGEPHA